MRPARLAPGIFACAARRDGYPEAMSGVDDEPISFESSPTGRFGLAAVSERGQGPAPAVAQGTPRPVPAVAQGTPRPVPQGQGSGLPLDGPTLEHTPIPVGLIEENAPLDRDAGERGLLAAIASGDESSRAIYADWLEERSEHARAGFLRIEQLVARMAPADPRYDACTRQLRELEQHIDPDWRARVGRPPIEGCPAFAYRCPRRWDALTRTDPPRCSMNVRAGIA